MSEDQRGLFKHVRHTHVSRNPNAVHKEEVANGSFNARVAVKLTAMVGTMWTAYSFAVLAIIGLLAILGVLSPLMALLVAWLSQTFIQLTLLPVIMVGSNVLARKSEIQSEEQFNTTMKAEHNTEQVMLHLTAQDGELLKQTSELLRQASLLVEIRDLLKTKRKTA